MKFEPSGLWFAYDAAIFWGDSTSSDILTSSIIPRQASVPSLFEPILNESTELPNGRVIPKYSLARFPLKKILDSPESKSD